jgi:transposase
MSSIRKPYPSDVSDEEWSLVAPHLTLMDEAAPQRQHSLRELFNSLRYVLRYGIAWRAMPNDLPPWSAVYQQSQRWLAAGVFEALAQDLRALLRVASGRAAEPTAAIIDSRTLRSTPESGPRAGYDGAKRKRGSKLHMAVDTLGHLLALHVTPANVDDRAEVGKLAAAVQEATGESVELIYVDQGYTGANAAEAAKAQSFASSNWPKRRRASCCCPSAGWSSVHSPGRRDAGGSSKTTSVMRRPSQRSTSSPSHVSCSSAPQISCSKVHNTL